MPIIYFIKKEEVNFNKNWYKKDKLAILKQNNIDPILSLYNMVIAPNLR